MASERFRIPYPERKSERNRWAKEYGTNAYWAGKHWAVRKKDADYWHRLTTICMNQQDVRRTPFKRPTTIFMYWNDHLDIDNHSIMGKMIVDALKGRVIEDDGRRWLKGVHHLFHDEDCILVEIKEVSK